MPLDRLSQLHVLQEAEGLERSEKLEEGRWPELELSTLARGSQSPAGQKPLTAVTLESCQAASRISKHIPTTFCFFLTELTHGTSLLPLVPKDGMSTKNSLLETSHTSLALNDPLLWNIFLHPFNNSSLALALWAIKVRKNISGAVNQGSQDPSWITNQQKKSEYRQDSRQRIEASGISIKQGFILKATGTSRQ